MKYALISTAIVAITFSAMTQASGLDHSEYAFDKADGGALPASNYQANNRAMGYSNSGQLCGDVRNIVKSPMLGSYDDYKHKYAAIGQLDAEISNINGLNSEMRGWIGELISSAKEQIEYGDKVAAQNAADIEQYKRQFPERSSEFDEMARDSIEAKERAVKDVNKSITGTVMNMMNVIDSRSASPMMGERKKLLDEWNTCRYIWNNQIESNYTNSYLRPAIRGVDRQY